MENSQPTIGEYLLKKLQDYGVDHIFGIPGDYVVQFFDMIEKSPIQHIGMTREETAGFAADAYARVKGIGAACVTYGVGGLSMINAVTAAYAEKSPFVVISGSPGIKERREGALLHHKGRDFYTQQRIYDEITVASALLDEPFTAFNEIDRVLDAVYRQKRPGYIELPRDMVSIQGQVSNIPQRGGSHSDSETLDAALANAIALINQSEKSHHFSWGGTSQIQLSKQITAACRRKTDPCGDNTVGQVSDARSTSAVLGYLWRRDE